MLLLIFSIFAYAGLPKEAMDPIYDEYEGVELSAALLRDGKVPAAHQVWLSLSEKEKSRPEANFLAGNIFSAEQNFTAALEFYVRAEGGAEIRGPLAIQKAKAYFALGQLEGCAIELKKLGEKSYQTEELSILRSKCEQNQALQHLVEGGNRLKSFSLFQEKIQLLLEKKLFLVAKSEAFQYLEKSPDPSEALRLAELFQSAQRWEDALLILENAKIRFPGLKDLLLAIAPLYHRKEWRMATIQAFESAAVFDRKYFEHSAELNRQSGNFFRSLQQIPLIPDEKVKLRLQLANYVDRGRWDLVSSLDTAVRRSDLRNDQEVGYALAFSLARLGKIARAKEYLAQVRSPALLAKATALRSILDRCESGKGCNL